MTKLPLLNANIIKLAAWDHICAGTFRCFIFSGVGGIFKNKDQDFWSISNKKTPIPPAKHRRFIIPPDCLICVTKLQVLKIRLSNSS